MIDSPSFFFFSRLRASTQHRKSLALFHLVRATCVFFRRADKNFSLLLPRSWTSPASAHLDKTPRYPSSLAGKRTYPTFSLFLCHTLFFSNLPFAGEVDASACETGRESKSIPTRVGPDLAFDFSVYPPFLKTFLFPNFPRITPFLFHLLYV